jgi:hypothetical protein
MNSQHIVARVLQSHGALTAITGTGPVYELSDMGQYHVANAISQSIRTHFPVNMLSDFESLDSLTSKVHSWICSHASQ